MSPHRALITYLTYTVYLASAISPVQPHFPDGCQVPLLPVSELRYGKEEYALGLTLTRCWLVGEACTSDRDCPVPSPEQCKAGGGIVNVASPINSRCVDGICRQTDAYEGEICDCLQGCHFKTSIGLARDQSCIKGICTAAPCAECGEQPAGKQCCGSGVVDHDGKCHCASGTGEGCGVNPSACKNKLMNNICCGKGTQNEGRCCAAGHCDGPCISQPR